MWVARWFDLPRLNTIPINQGFRLAPGSLFLWEMAGKAGVDEAVEQAIRDALSHRDKGMREIAREMGVGVSVVQRIKLEIIATHTPVARRP